MRMKPQDALKRAVDVVVALLMIGVTLPLWAVIAIAVRSTSRGPVLYLSARAGLDGRRFHMLKFRTMNIGADRQGPGITAHDDPRITPFGRILRRTKLDELPQLINVVRGDMSLVGPRPEAPEYVSMDDSVQRAVLSVRPGITGPTQLLYRHEEHMLEAHAVDVHYREVLLPKKLALDLQYVETRGFFYDVRLLIATVWRLMPHRRAS